MNILETTDCGVRDCEKEPTQPSTKQLKRISFAVESELKEGDSYEEQEEDFNTSTGSVLGVVELKGLSAGKQLSIDLLVTLPHKGQLQISAAWLSGLPKVRNIS